MVAVPPGLERGVVWADVAPRTALEAAAALESSGRRQQHIIRRDSRRVSQGSTSIPPLAPALALAAPSSSLAWRPSISCGWSSWPASSTALPSAVTWMCGSGPAGCCLRAPAMASALRGVVALPYLSVWVMKSGTGTWFWAAAAAAAATAAWSRTSTVVLPPPAARGVFRTPGLRRSPRPRTPAGVLASLYLAEAGVEASVRGVPPPLALRLPLPLLPFTFVVEAAVRRSSYSALAAPAST
mmetsp:Transcript_16022/g.38274  ORF Transcript_16022/g.38274 Transcript_16022/m.38274 type:complete len:241 (-) Transcript_16022:784-1506(-)